MLKKLNIILIIIILIVVGIKFIPFGSYNYQNSEMSSVLKIPRLSIFDEECCMYSAKFKSFRSKYSLQQELDKIMQNYDKKTCNSRVYYYDNKNDITITEYGVKSEVFINSFYIVYDKGNYSNVECNKITDHTSLEYQYYHSNDIKYGNMKFKFDYLNEDLKTYNVYTDCNDCLYIKKGMGQYESLKNMLKSSYISMNTLIKFLDYQVDNGKAEKEVYKDGGSVLYKNDDFSLLKCNTIEGNKDIYISDKLEYRQDYCK